MKKLLTRLAKWYLKRYGTDSSESDVDLRSTIKYRGRDYRVKWIRQTMEYGEICIEISAINNEGDITT